MVLETYCLQDTSSLNHNCNLPVALPNSQTGCAATFYSVSLVSGDIALLISRGIVRLTHWTPPRTQASRTPGAAAVFTAGLLTGRCETLTSRTDAAANLAAATARWLSWRRRGVRSKVVAVLAVPLLLATTIGAIRVQSQIADASQLAEAARSVEVIPVVYAINYTAGTAAFSQARGTITDGELAALNLAITNAEHAIATRDIPGGRTPLATMVSAAKTVRDRGKAIAFSLTDVQATMDVVRDNSAAILLAALRPVPDLDLGDAKWAYVDALIGRSALMAEGMALVRLSRGQPEGVKDMAAAISAERALLRNLARHYPADNPRIAELWQGLNARAALAASAPSSMSVIALRDAATSGLRARDIYGDIAQDESTRILSTVNQHANLARSGALRDAALVAMSLLAALALAIAVARSLIVPLRRLRDAAHQVASHVLPEAVSRLRNGGSVTSADLPTVPVHTAEEVGQVARAVDSMQDQALRLAGEQAVLRRQMNDMFETLARRNKSLVDQQLTVIESMESRDQDPHLLDKLFRLDHLAARLRRNGENLLVLAGTQVRKPRTSPSAISDIMRAAVSEVEDYQRVKFTAPPQCSVTDSAAVDLVHVFAELLDNALHASPPDSIVRIGFARASDNGLLVEVADRGFGVATDRLADINTRLRPGAEVSAATARHMGLFVVGKLAERHDFSVWLRPTVADARDPGLTVTVHIPATLLSEDYLPPEEVREERHRPGAPVRPMPGPPDDDLQSLDLSGVRRGAELLHRSLSTAPGASAGG